MRSDDDRRLDPDREQRPTVLLNRVARTLGIDVGEFFDGSDTPSCHAQTSELLEIWHRIDDDTEKRSLIDMARKLSRS